MKGKERERAAELFGTSDEPTELARTIMGIKSKGFSLPATNGNDAAYGKERIYTEDEKRRMRAAIQAAKSLTEMAQLEKAFAEGKIPAYVLEGGEPMET